MTFETDTPYLQAVHRFCPSAIFCPGCPARIGPDRQIVPISQWRRQWQRWRSTQRLFLPGDFIELGPVSMVLDDEQPYSAVVVNIEHGTNLHEWLAFVAIGSSLRISDLKHRRIADLCQLILTLLKNVRADPFRPECGRLQPGQKLPLGVSRCSLTNGEEWVGEYSKSRSDGTIDYPLTWFACLDIVSRRLQECIQVILDEGTPSSCASVLGRVAALGTHPFGWPDSATSDLEAIPGELLALTSSRRLKQVEVTELREAERRRAAALALALERVSPRSWSLRADPSARAIKMQRVRSAYLEEHGSVKRALEKLRAEGVEMGMSTFYDIVKRLDDEYPGWRDGVLKGPDSGLSGIPEIRGGSRILRKRRGKPG
jgi:hypothetical protein